MSALVVLGSGTDAGKTFVTCRLLEDLRARGARPRVRKPVVSGFVDDDASDPRRLMAAAHSDEALDVVSPWRLRDPISPDQAARNEGVVVSFDAVVAACAVEGDIVVEAAGGVMSPLCETHTQVDLAAALGAGVVVVVDASYLGSISHGLSAVSVVVARGLDVVAVVVNRGPSEPFRRFLRSAPTAIFDVDERAAIADRISGWFAASCGHSGRTRPPRPLSRS